MTNWKTEYKVDFHILEIRHGARDIERFSIIVEGKSSNHVEQVIKGKFFNVAGFSIDKITKIWEY